MTNDTIVGQWTTSLPPPFWWGENVATLEYYTIPTTTSIECYNALEKFLQPRNADPSTLYVATEASSHPTGVVSLNAQPWYYGGGGLGNMEECPLQVCLAGGARRDSILFASVCIVPECTAFDLAAPDFISRLTDAAGIQQQQEEEEQEQVESVSSAEAHKNNDHGVILSVAQEYVTLHARIAEINKYLSTGWTCGEYHVKWQHLYASMYFGTVLVLLICTLLGTCFSRHSIKKKKEHGRCHYYFNKGFVMSLVSSTSHLQQDVHDDDDDDDGHHRHQEEKKEVNLPKELDEEEQQKLLIASSYTQSWKEPSLSSSSSSSSSSSTPLPDPFHQQVLSAFDLRRNWSTLFTKRPETACLDGFKVGSILWVILGHVLAIQSGSAGGYGNPKDILPPYGFTSSTMGQVIFSSRFAVDTFLILSGYLVVHVLRRKVPPLSSTSNKQKFLWTPVSWILFRMLRILPLYIMCLGFWVWIAPHVNELSSLLPTSSDQNDNDNIYPFWYQWRDLLEPCYKLWWTNILFINNVVPLVPTTATCFYHSWYLAVDVQLFIVFAPWLVLLYKHSPYKARYCTIFLWTMSLLVTIYLTFTRQWSSNSLDGAAVARFDMEGYSKPHVRAQSYLAGMYIAMLSPPTAVISNYNSQNNNIGSKWLYKQQQQQQQLELHYYHKTQSKTIKLMMLSIFSLLGLTFVTFLPANGGYARRACRYEEWPFLHDCGSTWTETEIYLYTCLSRAIWSICLSCLLYTCLHVRQFTISRITSWYGWTPFAHLSFGAYLIHPIVLFIWQLGNSEKQMFRIMTFGMSFISVTVVTFMISAMVAIVIEIPCHNLLQLILVKRLKSISTNRADYRNGDDDNDDRNNFNRKHHVNCEVATIPAPIRDNLLGNTTLQEHTAIATDFRLPMMTRCDNYGTLLHNSSRRNEDISNSGRHISQMS